MRINKLAVIIFILSIVLTGVHCSRDKASIYSPYEIVLRWIPAYEDETWDDVRTGLLWSFSLLGASLPAGSFDLSVAPVNDRSFICDFSKLGFSKEALLSLQVIFDRLKASEEYESMGGIDLGRLLMLTLYSSNHYYRITGTNPSFSTVRDTYMPDTMVQFGITHSSVAFDDRLILMPVLTDSFSGTFYAATEGTGSLADSSFAAQEYETFDLMPNGQLRFAIYDAEGNLQEAVNALISRGGKPGKCMWCHESNALTLFSDAEPLPGYLTAEEFVNRIELTNSTLASIRNAMSTDLVFSNKQDHTKSELLYISFMEPSVYRLANEWNITLSEAESIVSQLSQHDYPEFPFLGKLYHRADVDHLAHYATERVPESAREYSVYEPDFF